jgi:hypothetical protein
MNLEQKLVRKKINISISIAVEPSSFTDSNVYLTDDKKTVHHMHLVSTYFL